MAVDAHSHPVSLTFPGSDHCKPRSCTAPAWLGLDKTGEIPKYMCPPANVRLINDESLPPSSLLKLPHFAGCLSNCSLLGTDAACCKGNYSSLSVCSLDPNPALAQACPEAYSYAFSNAHRSVLTTCKFDNGTKHEMTMTFCPETQVT